MYSKATFPTRLQEIMDHATDKNMVRRYQSCREFRKDLERMSPQTHIDESRPESIAVTVGREDCDITINDPMMKVSRVHLEISLRLFTGGSFYVMTDRSSNGTMVDGRRLSRGESINIHTDGPLPQVFMACDASYPLDWKAVVSIIKAKQASLVANEPEKPDTDDNKQEDHQSQELPPTNKEMSFFKAIKLYFTRAFDFRGRSRRKEYWYVAIFNFIVEIALIILMVLAGGERMGGVVLALSVGYSVTTLIPNLSLTIRRLHDIGKSWKVMLFWLLTIIPILGWIALIVLMVVWIIWMATDSERTENRWGPCPK